MPQKCQEVQGIFTVVCLPWSGKNFIHSLLCLIIIIFIQNEKALKGYRKARDAEGLAKIKEKMGDYDGAIRLLLKHNRITDALKYAAKYEVRRNVTISECYHVHYMASRYAEKLSKPTVQNSQADLLQFETVLNYLKLNERVTFYKAADMHERACEILKSEGKHSDLFRIYRAQGWYEDGIQLAKRKYRGEEATFIFFKATAELADGPGTLQESTIAMLKRKLDIQSETGAKAHLIYGRAINSNTMVKTARDYFTNRKHHNPFGQIEAFNSAVANIEYDSVSHAWTNVQLSKNEDLLTLTLTICKEIRSVTTALDPTKDPSSVRGQIISQLESFYGLEKKKVGEDLHELYFVPPSSYPWTNQLLKKLKVDKRITDVDGMLQLETETVYKGICTHLESYIEKWIVADELKVVEHFNDSFTSHPLRQEIAEGGYLHQSFLTRSFLAHSGKPQQGYFRLLCNAFDLAYYRNPQIDSKNKHFKAILDAISPQATCYLPVSSMPLQIQSDPLTKMLHEEANGIFTKTDQAFSFNKWFEAWRMNCVSRKGSQRMKEILIRKSNQHNKRGKEVGVDEFQLVYRHEKSQDASPFNIPPVYILDRNDEYQHLMLLWIKTCEEFRGKRTLPSCTIAVYNIVRHIASERLIGNTVSVSNLLNVVTIHTVAIQLMHAACSVRFQQEGTMYLPQSYKNVAEVFHIMNGPTDMDFHRTCIQYIMNRQKLPEVPPKLEKMLTIILKVMIGMHNKDFNPLRYALGREECLKNHEAHHCLIFVCTLFCNIGLINFNPSILHTFRLQIYKSVKHCKDPTLMNIYCRLLNSRTLLGCFGAIRELLESSKDSLLQASMSYNPRLRDIEIKFETASLNTPLFLNQQQLHPFPFHLRPEHSKHVVMRSSLRADAETFHPTSGVSEDNVDITSESHDVDPDIQPPELLAMDSIEADEDDPETRAALVIEPEQPTAPQSEIEKDSTVDYSFCSICACPVMGSTQLEAEDPSIISESAESLFHEHCRTEDHITNERIKSEFDSEEKEYFIPRRDGLLELLPKCRSLYKFRLGDQQLQHIVDATEGDLKEMEEHLSTVRNSAEWREGVYKLQNDFSGKLQFVHMTIMRLIEETEGIKQKIERDEKQQERKDEEEIIEDEQPDEDEVIVQNDYGEKGRVKKRKRKKNRGERKSKK